MDKLKYLSRNISLLNILLIVAFIFLVNYTVLPLFDMNIKYSLPVTKKIADTQEKGKEERKEEGKEEEEGEKEKAEQVQSQTMSNSDYMIIAEQNLFHPERTIPAEEKQIPKPEFVLYGTMISDDTKIAYLEDLKAPYSTPGRGKRQQALHLGNALSGYTLSEVHHDKVVMVRGENKIEVNIIDSAHPKNRDVGTATVKETGKTREKALSPLSKQPSSVLSPTTKDETLSRRDQLLSDRREKLKRSSGSSLPTPKQNPKAE